jgi:hypothetical protein
MTLSSQEQSCMDRMAKLVQEAPDKIVPYTPLTNLGNCGLVRSALQKNIRRGRYDQALRMAAYMKGPTSKELQYLWFSLQVCSIEDVGFGEPEAVGLALYGGLSSIRDKFGGDAVLSGVIKRLCVAHKSRACAEISLHGDIYRLDRFKEMAQWTDAQLLDTVLGSDVQDSYIAHCVLRGILPRAVRDTRRPLNREVIATIQHWLLNNQIVDCTGQPLSETDRWAAAVSADRATDCMHCGLFAAMRDVRPGTTAKPDPETPEIVIRTLTSVAFDKHTRLGRIAMKAMYSSLRKDYPVMNEIPEHKAVQAIGSVVFNVEGAMVDSRLGGSPAAEHWRNLHDRAFSIGHGVPEHEHEKITNIVAGELPRLNDKRLWASNLVSNRSSARATSYSMSSTRSAGSSC